MDYNFPSTTPVTFEKDIVAQMGVNTYYVRCMDTAGNKMTTSHTITFTVIPPGVNTAPTIEGIPDQNLNEDQTSNLPNIDLWSYAGDAEDATSSLTFTIISETDSTLIDCDIQSNRYLVCTAPAADQSGTSRLER